MFIDRRQKQFIFLFLITIPLFVLLFRLPSFSRVKFFFIDVLSGPIYVVQKSAQEVKKIIFYHRTFDEYKRLRNEVEILKSRMVGLEEVIQENKRLEQLLEVGRNLVYSSVAAEVMGGVPSYWSSVLVINKGEKDGIRRGHAVVNEAGVVGKVLEVGPRSSKVILLTDPQFSVAAVSQNGREVGVVSGALRGMGRMKYVNMDAEIQVGDKIVTSQRSGAFPRNLLIGEVVDVVKNVEDNSLECVIKPAVNFSQVEEVLVLMGDDK